MDKIWLSQNFAKMDLPGLAKRMTNGYISDEQDGETHKLNYTLFPCLKDDSPETKPVIFWTMGGPAASAVHFWRSLGGPIRAGRPTLEFNLYSWNKFANVVSIDYPWGTGYSRNSYHPKNDSLKTMQKKKAARLNRFVKKFFKKNSE